MTKQFRRNRFHAHLARNLRTGLPGIVIAAALAAGAGLPPKTAYAGGHETDRSAGEVISDSWITTKVKSKLVADRKVSGFDIQVETRDGVVKLSGEVSNQSEVSHAIELARSTEGVKRVDAASLRLGTALEQVKDVVDGGDGR